MTERRRPDDPDPASSPALPPRPLVRSVVLGLALMAVFTLWWASDTFYGWTRPAAAVFLAAGVVAALAFAVRAVQLVRAAGRFPEATGTAGDGDRRRRNRVFGMVCAAEGVGIGLAAGLLSSDWEDADAAAEQGRPRRRLYEVTGATQVALAEHRLQTSRVAPLGRAAWETP